MCVIDRRPNSSKACVQLSFFSTVFLCCIVLALNAAVSRFIGSFRFQYITRASNQAREREKSQCICFISQLCNTLLYSRRLSYIHNLSAKSFWLDLSLSRSPLSHSITLQIALHHSSKSLSFWCKNGAFLWKCIFTY